MRRISPSVFRGAALLLVCLFLLPACSGLQPASDLDIKTESRVRELTQRNARLKTSKGSGWVSMTTGNGKERLRFAWAAAMPGKLRMTLLSSGHPVETLVADGERVTIISHTGSHAPHTLSSGDPSLDRIVSVSITLGDILELLAGRIPLEAFDAVSMDKKTSGEETLLRLTRKWRGTVARIHINDSGDAVLFQPLNTREEPVYTLILDDYRQIGHYRIPYRWTVTDPDGRTLAIDLSVYAPDVPIKDAVFILTDSR